MNSEEKRIWNLSGPIAQMDKYFQEQKHDLFDEKIRQPKAARTPKYWGSRDKSTRTTTIPDRLGMVVDVESDEVTSNDMIHKVQKLSDGCLRSKLKHDSFLDDIANQLSTPRLANDVVKSEKRTAANGVGRSCLKAGDLPEDLVTFLHDHIVYSEPHGYKHVTPYMKNNVQLGWGAQIKVRSNQPPVRIGTFDDPYVAAIAVAATKFDTSLLDCSMNAKKWLHSVVEDESELYTWLAYHMTE